MRARRLLVATGVRDELPAVPGLVERWGRDVLHRPYCHGFEVRGAAIGILATSTFGVHQALLWRQWSPKITLFTAVAGTTVTVEPEQREQPDARGILVLDVAVAGVVVTEDPLNGDRLSGDRLSGVRLADGTTRELAALVAAGRVTPNDGALSGLHLARTEVRMGEVMFGSVLEADANGATPIPGVWVAGNVADLRAQVIGSAAAGVNAAGMINSDLVQEDVQRAVAARRDATGEQAHPHHVWDELNRTREQFWSGRPNAVLEQTVAPLPPGKALDLGCGEGGDALWLASRGWQVLGVDVSDVALTRLAETVSAAGAAERITLQHANIATDFTAGTYDLVSAQFLHSPIGFPREQVLRRATAAVAPGGLLLVVGHADVPPWGGHDLEHAHDQDPDQDHDQDQRPGLPDVDLPGPGEVLSSLQLDEGAWEVQRCDLPERIVTGPDGEQAVLRDSVLAVRRRPAGPNDPT